MLNATPQAGQSFTESGIGYVVEAVTLPDPSTFPNVARDWTERGVAAQMVARRPRGRTLYLFNVYESGALGLVCPIGLKGTGVAS